jgi:hypothetical protein
MKTKMKKDKNQKKNHDSKNCDCNKDCENCKPLDLIDTEKNLENLSPIINKYD